MNADWNQYQVAGEQALQEGDYACAETMWLAAFEQAKKFPKFDARFAITLEGLAEAYWHQGKYQLAEQLSAETLEIFKITRGVDHADVGFTSNNLAMLYKAQGKYHQAEPLYKRSIEILSHCLGDRHPDVQNLLGNYADLLALMGHEEAPIVAAAAAAAAEDVDDDDDDLVDETGTKNSITGSKLTKSGQFQVLDLQANEQLCDTGQRHAINASSDLSWNQFRQLGEAEVARGDLPKAETFWTGALRKAATFDERDPRLAITLESLAEVLWRQGKYSAAEPLCLRTLQVYEVTLGPNHPDIGIIANNLAMLYHAQRDYAAAEPLYKRALPIRTKALGSEHPAVINLLNNYKNLLKATGRYADAEALNKEATSITSGRWTRSGSYQKMAVPAAEKLH